MGKYTDESNRGPEKRASYNMTMEQMDELHYQQAHDLVPMVKCNISPEDEIKQVEAKHFFYVEMEAPLFDSGTGEKLSTPKKVLYHENMYKHMKKINAFNGYQVRILHDPIKYRESVGDKVKGIKQAIKAEVKPTK